MFRDKLIAICYYLIIGYLIVSYIVNLIQFCNCDFEEPYKKEIIKGIGLTGLSFATVWIANNKEGEE